jgi:hypothetical protein
MKHNRKQPKKTDRNYFNLELGIAVNFSNDNLFRKKQFLLP